MFFLYLCLRMYPISLYVRKWQRFISAVIKRRGTACNSMWAPKRCLYTKSLSSVAIRHARGTHLGYIWQTGKWVVYTFLSIIQTGKTPLVESISGRFILSTMALIICTAALSLPRKGRYTQLRVLWGKLWFLELTRDL